MSGDDPPDDPPDGSPMSSDESPLDPNLIEQTKQQIRSLVNEIAALSKQDFTPQEFYGEFLNRVVAALAAVHDTMARSDWASIDLAELIGSSLAPFGKSPRVCIEGERIRVTLEIGRSLGMVLHELATNAAKYGSLSAPKGAVQPAAAAPLQASAITPSG